MKVVVESNISVPFKAQDLRPGQYGIVKGGTSYDGAVVLKTGDGVVCLNYPWAVWFVKHCPLIVDPLPPGTTIKLETEV